MSDDRKYAGITDPLILNLLKELPRQQWYIQEERRLYEEEMALAERVFGKVIREVFGDPSKKKSEEPSK